MPAPDTLQESFKPLYDLSKKMKEKGDATEKEVAETFSNVRSNLIDKFAKNPEKLTQMKERLDRLEALWQEKVRALKNARDVQKTGILMETRESLVDAELEVMKKILEAPAGAPSPQRTPTEIETPPVVVSPSSSKKAPGESDKYTKEWSSAKDVPNRYKDGEYRVNPDLSSVRYRNDKGELKDKITAGEEVEIDNNSKAKQIDDATFVKIADEELWLDTIALVPVRSEESQKRWVPPVIFGRKKETKEAGNEKREIRVPDESKEMGGGGAKPGKETEGKKVELGKSEKERAGIDLKFLGPLYPDYVPVLEKIAEYGNAPDGVSFDLPFSGSYKKCRVLPENGQYVLQYEEGTIRYKHLENLLNDINDGGLNKRLMEGAIRKEINYKKYQDLVGTVDENEWVATKNGRQIHLELDWTNPDPQVYIAVQPHGKIIYAVNRENVGLYGEKVSHGTAATFEDFMRQLGHLRGWAEDEEHKKIETHETRKEILFRAIANPESFKKEESEIGRVASFNIMENEVVQLYLDWGGGVKDRGNLNPMLNVWVAEDGTLRFILNNKAVKEGPLKAENFSAMVDKIRELKEKVTGGTITESIASPTAPENIENKNIEGFLREKGLLGIEHDGKYIYMLGDPRSNPDIAGYWNKAIHYLTSILQSFSEEDLQEVREIRQRARSEKSFTTNADALQGIMQKMSPENRQKFEQFLKLEIRSRQESMLEFTKRPNLNELKTRYQKKFLPAWKKGEAELDRMIQGEGVPAPPPVVESENETGTGPSPESPGNKPDIYKEEWHNGKNVKNPFEDYKGSLFVQMSETLPPDEKLNLRDDKGEIVDEIPNGTEVTMSNPEVKGRAVRGATFVQVKYNNKDVWVSAKPLKKMM